VLLTIVALSALVVIWNTTHDGGTAGTLMLKQQQCAQGACTWYGKFTSDDHNVAYGDVPLADSVSNGRVNQVVNVRYSNELGEAYLANGSTAWVEPAVMTAVGAVYTAGAATWHPRPPRRRRGGRRRRAAATAVPTSPA
jgi:hypothetical protein